MYDLMISMRFFCANYSSEKLCWPGRRSANSGSTITPSLPDDCGQIPTSCSGSNPSLTVLYSLRTLALGVGNLSYRGDCRKMLPSLRVSYDYIIHIMLPIHLASTQRERTAPYMSVTLETELSMLCKSLSVGTFASAGTHGYLGGNLSCKANRGRSWVTNGRSVTSADSAGVGFVDDPRSRCCTFEA